MIEREFITPADKHTSLTTLYDQALAIQAKCEDYQVDNANLRNMVFHSNGCTLRYLPTGFSEGESRTKSFTQYSLGQFCSKLGVPAQYVDKCIDSGRLELAEDNINSWLDDFDKNLFLREYDNTIRGVLSDRYSVFDAPNIIDVLGNSIPGDYRVKEYFLTPERFHARLIQKDFLPIQGEDLFAGLQVDSSDVGRSILIVRFFIYKQVCTNGMVVSQGNGVLYQQKHIGIDSNEFYHELVASLDNVPAIAENVVQFIGMAKKEDAKFRVTRFNEQQMKEFTERVKLQTRLSDESIGKVVELMSEKYSQSRWGLINSITEVAQEYTLERRIELERMAGSLLVA